MPTAMLLSHLLDDITRGNEAGTKRWFRSTATLRVHSKSKWRTKRPVEVRYKLVVRGYTHLRTERSDKVAEENAIHSAKSSLVERGAVGSLQTADHPGTNIGGSGDLYILFYFRKRFQ